MGTRTVNLLGALVVAVGDALQAAIAHAAQAGQSSAAAMTTLHHFPGLAVGQLTRWMGLSQSAGVRLVDRLVDDGLVERGPGADGRSVLVEVTEDGHVRAEEILLARRRLLEDLMSALTPDEERQLGRLLEKLLTHITVDGPHANLVCRLCDIPACPNDRCPVTIGAMRRSDA